jgi:hypothetical protein
MSSKPSGAQYRKRKAKAEADAKASAKVLCGFLSRASQSEPNKDSLTARSAPLTHTATGSDDNYPQVQESTDGEHREDLETTVSIVDDNTVDKLITDNVDISTAVEFDLNDIGKWPTLTSSIRDELIRKRPHEIVGPDSRFPLDAEKGDNSKERRKHRKFSLFHCKRKLSNNEISSRTWLQYSDAKNSVYCFCCKLFGNSKSQLAGNGINNWKNIGRYLAQHEVSSEHFSNYAKWKDAEKSLLEDKGIDAELQKAMKREVNHWKCVMERLLDITMFLSEHNLAFRGNKDKLFSKNNGNFLGLVQLIGKYDPVISEHIRKIQSKEIHDHYLGKTIQNELINLLGNKVKEEIVNSVKEAKYFSVILDCTPDVSHQEQLSFTVRFVKCYKEQVKVKEHFLSFRPVSDTTGEGLTNSLVEEMNMYGLDMNNCRGQGYDNGANMVGKNKGIQSRVLSQFPRAFFNPCGCHSLNLVIADAATSSVKSVSLFGVIQRLFVLFSSSTKRWKIIQDTGIAMTLKEVCETRWESRVNSLKSVRYHMSEICEALSSMEEEVNDPKATSEAKSLETHIASYDFILTLIVWYDILFQINLVSKNMQKVEIDLQAAVALLKNCKDFLENYRETGYGSAGATAKEIADELGIEAKFKQPRLRKKKAHFSYESSDQVEALADSETNFKVNVFYPIIDNALGAIQERFSQLQTHSSDWEFMYDVRNLPESDSLKTKCFNIEKILTDPNTNEMDVNGRELHDELIHLQALLKNTDVSSPQQCLTYLAKNGMIDCFSNVWIALRVLLTMPVSVASGERSFSKLKLIKTYLRSTMTQERLSSLAILSIENDVAKNVDFSVAIETFANSKTNRGKFK